MSAMSRKKRKLTLLHFFVLAQYLGAAFVMLIYPFLPPTVTLFSQVNASSRFMLLWPCVLLTLAVFCDRAYVRAWKKDDAEIRAGIKNAGMNRSTLLALVTPCLLILDGVCVAHLYQVYFASGGVVVFSASLPLGCYAAAIALALWIAGRRMPNLPWKSRWGIRTRDTLENQQVWGRAHLRAARPVCLCGAAAWLCSLFLPPAAGLCAAAAALLAAVWLMFSPRRMAHCRQIVSASAQETPCQRADSADQQQ